MSPSRRFFSAAHVVADPSRSSQAETRPHLDMDATLAFRRHLAGLGLGIAEAMDTAQRGMGVGWSTAAEIIDATLAEVGDRTAVACGVVTDQIAPDASPSLAEIVDAYLEQLEFVESRGGIAVVMCSRHLARVATSPQDYLEVYQSVLTRSTRPVILHWLGEMFDPALAGYFSAGSLDVATEVVLELTGSGRVDGIKLSLLDAAFEVSLRRRLPAGVRMYTGDDFHYPELIAGDDQGYSDALLGAFDPLAAVAAAALTRLDAGDVDGFRSLLDPTVPLARLIFEAPTQFYKTGVVWLAYLSGHQDYFRMVAGAESGRSAHHLAQVYRLADGIDLFPDAELARRRANAVLSTVGVDPTVTADLPA